MKKILIFLISLISFADCFSQVSPPIVAAGSNGQTLLYPNLFTGRSFRVPAFSDTISLNTVPTLDSAGKLAYTYDCNCLWFRQNAPHKWVRINSTNGNNGSDTLFAQLPAFFDSTSHPGSTILKILHDNGLLFGGTVTLDSCMSVDVSAGAIIINYNQINFAQTLGIVIPAADPTFDRIDAIIVDSTGRVFDSVGVASATPAYITVNSSSQVLLTYINVPAGATCLPIIQGIIFDGASDFPSQWNPTSAGGLTVDFSNTDNPFHKQQAAFISKYTNGSSVTFTKPSGYDTAIAGAILRFSLYLNGLMSNQIRGVLLKDGVPVTNNLVLNPYFNPNDSNQYQIPSVPLSAWSFTNRTGAFNGVRFSFGGYDTTGVKGLYFDYIQIQTGFSPQTKSFVDSVKNVSNRLVYYINGLPTDGGAIGGGGGSETWEQTLINQGSTPFSADHAVDFGNHELDFNNLSIFSANSNDDGAMGLFAGSGGNTFVQIDTTGIQFRYSNVNNSAITLSNDGIELYTQDADVFIGQRLDGSNTSPVHLFADTLTSTPQNSLWEDNDGVVHKGVYPNITADNGLTLTTGNIQLGGTLLGNTSIQTGANTLTIESNAGANAVLQINDVGSSVTGFGVNVSGSGNAIQASTDDGYSFSGTSSIGPAAYFQSFTLQAVQLVTTLTTDNDVKPILTMERDVQFAAAGSDGIGGSIDFRLAAVFGISFSNKVVSKFLDASSGLSEFSIIGNSGSGLNTVFQVSGTGLFTLTQGLQNFANNAAAISGGLTTGNLYRNGDIVQIVH